MERLAAIAASLAMGITSTFFRTQRRLFEGHVLVHASRVPRMA